jgi:hypothetical protein
MPEKLKVQATVPEHKDASGKVTQAKIGPFTIEVETGATATESIKLFGDDAVKSNSDSNWIVTLQSNMRSGMKKGETEEQLQSRLGNAKMGVTVRGAVVDPKQAFILKFQNATPQEQAKMIEELKAAAKK